MYRRLYRSFLPILLLFTFSIISVLSTSAATQTFPNPMPISVPGTGTGGVANPYPSIITVTNMPGVITDVNVTLFNISHEFPDDLDVLLVGPAGQKVILMADAGCNYVISGVTLTFDQSADAPLPDDGQIVDGTY